MFDFFNQQRQLIGHLLVALQFGLLLLLGGLAAPRVWLWDIPVISLTLAGLSVVLAIWTLRHNRVGNFNVHPAPKTAGMLVTSGPYRLIRHPMYSAVLLGAAALALLGPVTVGLTVWVTLLWILLAKAGLEERWMREHHSAYHTYCQQTKRFLPWVL